MIGALAATEYSCGSNANRLIERWFGDCVYTPWETLAFCIGLSSVFFWIIAQLPQFISNFLRSAADALSPWFLAQWLAGDTFNFLGCVLTGDQLKTQTITAGYFIFSDLVIITQYLYYQIRNRKALGGDYSDSDESLHKGSAYADAMNVDINRDETLEKLLDRTLNTKASSKEGFSTGNQRHSDFRDYQATLGKFSYGVQIHQNFDPVDGTSLQLPSVSNNSKQQSSWIYEHRHRLRRLVQEYGLEYGQVSAARLNSLYNSKQKEKHMDSNELSSRGLANRLRRPRYKAVLGVAGLFGLACVSSQRASTSRSSFDKLHLEFQVGRRVLLAFPDVDMERATRLGDGHPAAAYLAGQLLYLAFPWTKIIGQLLGWGSSALYLGSRLSQIVKNKQRRTAEGLSLGMVTCAVLANVTYGTSIVMRGPSWDNLIGKAPWLIGSFGTVFLDFSIFIQARYYSRHSKKGTLNEHTPLLS